MHPSGQCYGALHLRWRCVTRTWGEGAGVVARSVAAESAQGVAAVLVGATLGIAFTVWSLWVTVVAFMGGAAPLVEFDGPSFARGMLVLVFGVPIFGTIVYWVGVALTATVAIVVGGVVDLLVRD